MAERLEIAGSGGPEPCTRVGQDWPESGDQICPTIPRRVITADHSRPARGDCR